MRSVIVALILTVAVGLTASAQTSTCPPNWTSWGTVRLACESGDTCDDFFGHRIEVLHVNAQTRLAYIRDLDKRTCLPGEPTKPDVLYSTGKVFKYADCVLPTWRLVEEFAAFEAGCYPRSTVISVARGVISVVTPARK